MCHRAGFLEARIFDVFSVNLFSKYHFRPVNIPKERCLSFLLSSAKGLRDILSKIALCLRTKSLKSASLKFCHPHSRKLGLLFTVTPID